MANIETQWLEQNRRRTYPFRDDEIKFSAPYDTYDTKSLFVDAYIVYESSIASDDADDSWCLYSINASTFSLVIKNIYSGTTVNLSTPDTNTNIGDYKSLMWLDTANGIALTLILRYDDHPISSIGSVVLTFNKNPIFNPRVIDKQVSRVNKIELTGAISFVSTGETGALQEGNNITIQVNPDIPIITSLRLNEDKLRPEINRIVVSASPGAGAGRLDTGACSDVSTDILTINNTGPNNGNLNLNGGACYNIMPAVDESYTPIPAELEIKNDCTPCCDCDDFVDVYEGIRQLKNRGLVVSGYWQQISNKYRNILDVWAEKTECATGCKNQLFAYSHTGWLVNVEIRVSNLNSCSQTGGAVAVVNFLGGTFDLLYVPGSGMIYNDEGKYQQYDPTQVGNTFTMSDNSGIEVGSYKVFVFSVRFKPTLDRTVGKNVQITADITSCNQSSELLTTSVSLLSNTQKP